MRGKHLRRQAELAPGGPVGRDEAPALVEGDDAFLERPEELRLRVADLRQRLAANRRRIEAGAYRLDGRYLLDGGSPGPALKSYWRALQRSPRFALGLWHRMLYALLSLLGGKDLAGLYYQLRQMIRRQEDNR